MNKIVTLQDISKAYSDTKAWLLQSEDITNKVAFSSLNEIRNTLDHVMRAAVKDDKNQINTEHLNALKHLYRAKFDAMQLILSHLMTNITQNLEGFNPKEIDEMIPNYYSEIGPRINEIIKFLSEPNSKKGHPLGEINIEELTNVVFELKDYDETITKSVNQVNSHHVKSIINYFLFRKHKTLTIIIITSIITLIITILVLRVLG